MTTLLRATFCLALSAVLANAAPAAIVISNAIEDLNHLAGNAQDRNEMILNNTGSLTGRFGAVRFDTAIIGAEGFTNSSLFTLESATLTLTEQAGRNGNNGSLSGRVGAYFFNTTENSDWSTGSAASVNSGNAGSDSTTPAGDGWFGNTLARPGNFGGGATGANNVDNRSNGAANALISFTDGVAFQNHTFDASNSAETVTIDLTAGGASLEEIQSLLADWVAGNNAGIGLIGEFGNQAFFQSNGIAAGNSVGSSIDGDTSLSGLSIDDGSVAGGIGGSGLGQGTISLNLEFTAVTSIPEPSSALLLIGATGAVVARRRRR